MPIVIVENFTPSIRHRRHQLVRDARPLTPEVFQSGSDGCRPRPDRGLFRPARCLVTLGETRSGLWERRRVASSLVPRNPSPVQPFWRRLGGWIFLDDVAVPTLGFRE